MTSSGDEPLGAGDRSSLVTERRERADHESVILLRIACALFE
jgi:hypothetical protein